MEKQISINEHFGKDFRNAINEALKQTRNYHRKKSVEKPNPKIARFRLLCEYKDGNKVYYPSLDFPYSQEAQTVIHDEWVGLMKLQRKIRKEAKKGNLVSICIFANANLIPYNPDHPDNNGIKSSYDIPIMVLNNKGFKWKNTSLGFKSMGNETIVNLSKLEKEKICSQKKQIRKQG